ncbi:Uma2 family endonuclease [Gloeothece verrucosa]|uniref:Putative restriction endonuclease domain-containing protein n=1 Tax=Gloeothece verrucosa (strain PCC 7822) TaxID=497965 RepID=E0U707_GLOV7|nr:Uma2 family endonuclease [Gloeothece verrucosa]ADN17163.1 protein of unknown function DUF820 [Gloeothece verrucosa PCC 7822]
MFLELKRLYVPPGERVLLRDVSWQEFEEVLRELGDGRAARLSYSYGVLEIMTPLPEHEKVKGLLGEFVRIIVDELGWECEPFGSTTFKSERMDQGVEPDESFYFQNTELVRGKDKIDLTVDPPPDLTIEVDITSRTRFDNYLLLGVPELWRYDGHRLQINLLQEGVYLESKVSSIFPMLSLVDRIPEMIRPCKVLGRSATVRAFRSWVREQLNKAE